MSILKDLPLDDVLYECVFSHLTMTDLFQLRAVSRSFYDIVTDYFCNMERIYLTARERMDKVAFEIVIKQNSSIKTLVIPNISEWITDDVIITIAINCKNLQRIALPECKNLSNQCLETLAKTCNQLDIIDMTGCCWIDNGCFNNLISTNERLREVTVRRCRSLDDGCIELMASGLHQLRMLDVSEISGISDRSVYAIAKHCKKLTHLSIIGCWRISDDGVRVLGEYCKQLSTFNCLHCRDISDRILSLLRSNGVAVDVEKAPHYNLNCLENSDLSLLIPQIHHNM